MKTKLGSRISYANVLATLALFAALGGSSYAAVKINGKSIKTRTIAANKLKKHTLTATEIKSGSLLAQDFAAGQLPAGSQGAKGEKGDKGDPGASGGQGPAGAITGNLPSGVTLRGTYAVRDTATAAPDEIQQPISFGLTLAVAPVAHYIKSGGPVPAGCTGTAAAPGADSGNLCIFESLAVNTGFHGEFDPVSGDNATTRFGAAVFAQSAAAGSYQIRGSWAVTG